MFKLLKRIDFKILFWIFFYLFIFLILLHNSFNYLDPDLGWHLKVGQEIVNTQSIPHLNHYNYTFRGNWVDHEWLSNIIVYTLYNWGGYLALGIFFSLIIVLVLILLNIFTYKFWPKISPFPIVLLQSLGILASLPHFGVRIQVIALLFLLLFLVILDAYNRNKNWKILLFLPPLIFIWACLHASFLIAFFLAIAWIFIKIIELIIFKSKFRFKFNLDYSQLLSFKKISIFTGFLLSSIGFTLLTPYHLKLYSFLSGYRDTFYQSHLQEWLSQFYFPLQYWQLAYLAILSSVFIFYIYYSQSSKKYFKLNLWNIFLVILFIVLSFKSRRHFPLMFVASFLFIISVWETIFKTDFLNKTKIWEWSLNKWMKFYLLLILFLVSVYQVVQIKFIRNPFNNFCQDYPCGAVRYLKNHPEDNSLKIFNNYDWGGYLIWVYPQRQLFIDGRLPQVYFSGKTILEEYYSFYKKNIDYDQKLKEYQIRLVLLPAKDKKTKFKNWEKYIFSIRDKDIVPHNYLRNYLSNFAKWKIVYQDSVAVIYKKMP